VIGGVGPGSLPFLTLWGFGMHPSMLFYLVGIQPDSAPIASLAAIVLDQLPVWCQGVLSVLPLL